MGSSLKPESAEAVKVETQAQEPTVRSERQVLEMATCSLPQHDMKASSRDAVAMSKVHRGPARFSDRLLRRRLLLISELILKEFPMVAGIFATDTDTQL